MPKSCSFRASMATRMRDDYLPAVPIQLVAPAHVPHHAGINAVVAGCFRGLLHARLNVPRRVPNGGQPVGAVPLRHATDLNGVRLERREPRAVPEARWVD